MANTNRDALQAEFDAADAAVTIAARNHRNAETRRRKDPAGYVAAGVELEAAGARLEAAEAALVALLELEAAAAAAALEAPDFVNLAFNF